MASTGMGAAGLQRNRPIPLNRPATPLPGYPRILEISRKSIGARMWEQQTLLSEVAPVKASLSQARGKDSQELPDSCSNTFERYVNSVHVGLSGRTSQERSQASGGRLIASSCQRWMRSGMVWHGEYWMRSFSVWPKDASVCSLLEVLEPCVARKYFLSAKACRGIISRADRRGKPLPKRLRDALEKQIMILAA